MQTCDALVLEILLSLGHVAFGADRWQEVLDDIVLPVTDLAVSLHLMCIVVVIVNVKPCIMREVTEGNFVEAFEECVVRSVVSSSTARG